MIRGGWTRGPVAVVTLAAVLAAGFAANLLWELQELEVAWPPVVVFLLGIALAGALAWGGRWLAGSEFPPDYGWQAARWGYAGALALLAVNWLTIAIRSAEGRPVGEPQLELLVSTSAGGLAGLAVGVRTASAQLSAERAERARRTTRFLNRTLRHEVLNELQVIEGYAGLLEGHVDGDGEEALSTLQGGVEELFDLVEQVREVADVQAGTADLEPVDVPALLQREADRLDDAHPAATVETDLPEAAQARATGAAEHVFRNLLTNAVEHGAEAPTVAVAAAAENGTVRVEVADDGPGVPEDERESLFEPDAEGTHGFGLHLVETLVRGYGGEVRLADDDPRLLDDREGATFVVELPRADGAVADGGLDGDERDEDDVDDGTPDRAAPTERDEGWADGAREGDRRSRH